MPCRLLISKTYSAAFFAWRAWKWPKRLNLSGLEHIFATKRRSGNRKGCHFRAAASEGMSAVPVIAFFLATFAMPNGLAVNVCQVFFSFASVAECFSAVGRGDCSPDLLHSAIEYFLARFVDVWGTDPFIPKIHWLLHYARELRRHGTLFACFVHERKHKCIRRYAVPTLNTRTYERTVLEEVTCQHMCNRSQCVP